MNPSTDKPQLCRQNCGYYGNPQWENLCSQCWRRVKIVENKINSPLDISVRSSFRRRIFQKIKDNFTGSNNYFTNSLQDPQHLTVQRSEVELNVIRYLSKHQFRCISAISIDLYAQIRQFIESIYHRSNSVSEHLDVDILSEEFSAFYRNIYNWSTSYFGSDLSDQEKDLILEAAEDCIFRIMYGSLFSLVYSSCEQEDNKLTQQFNSYHWVKPEMLNLKQPTAKFWHNNISAIQELNRIDEEITPRTKLAAITRCCKTLTTSLEHNNDNIVDADNLLPQLILVIIQGKPSKIQTNITFISKFTEPERLFTGENGYSFTTMRCALQYISNLTPEMLNIDKDQFVKLGKTIPDYCADIFLTSSLSKTSDAILLDQESILHSQLIESKSKQLNQRMVRLETQLRCYQEWTLKYNSLYDLEIEECLLDNCDVISCMFDIILTNKLIDCPC